MLRLLLESHIDSPVVRQVKRHRPACDIVSLVDWRGGEFLRKSDVEIIAEARFEGRTLVTYDQTTIMPLARELALTEESHAGLVFVSSFTIPQGNIGAMVRALVRLWDEEGAAEWTNRVYHLQRG